MNVQESAKRYKKFIRFSGNDLTDGFTAEVHTRICVCENLVAFFVKRN